MVEATTADTNVGDRPRALAPVAPGQRIEAVDILRGVAVLGIFLVNMLSFAGFRLPFEQMTTVDKAATVLIRFVAQAKFYPLFSLLFGWGMVIQMQRSEARGQDFVPFYVRRMLVLALIGLVHAVLIWHGDILLTYALLGIPLVLFRKASSRVLLVAFVICMLVPILISLPGPGADFREAYGNAAASLRADMIAGKQAGGAGNVFVAGSYPEVVAQRWRQVLFTYSQSLYWATHVFGMMLLGVWLGRQAVLRRARENQDRLRRAMWWSLGIGLALNALWVWASVAPPGAVPEGLYDLATRGARTIGGPALTLFYLTAVVLLAQRAAWHDQLSGLAAVGRMALTNYLLQSVISTLIFYGYGLGIYGELGPFLTLLLTLAIFRGQVFFSNWWLARYRFGPAEWLWRTLSYGRLQPMRSRGPAAGQAREAPG